jgi:hypothetical protein
MRKLAFALSALFLLTPAAALIEAQVAARPAALEVAESPPEAEWKVFVDAVRNSERWANLAPFTVAAFQPTLAAWRDGGLDAHGVLRNAVRDTLTQGSQSPMPHLSSVLEVPDTAVEALGNRFWLSTSPYHQPGSRGAVNIYNLHIRWADGRASSHPFREMPEIEEFEYYSAFGMDDPLATYRFATVTYDDTPAGKIIADLAATFGVQYIIPGGDDTRLTMHLRDTTFRDVANRISQACNWNLQGAQVRVSVPARRMVAEDGTGESLEDMAVRIKGALEESYNRALANTVITMRRR